MISVVKHINSFADFLIDSYARDGVILGNACATNPSVITKHKWFLDQYQHLQMVLDDFCEAVYVWNSRCCDFDTKIEGDTFIDYCRLAGHAYDKGTPKPQEANVGLIRDCGVIAENEQMIGVRAWFNYRHGKYEPIPLKPFCKTMKKAKKLRANGKLKADELIEFLLDARKKVCWAFAAEEEEEEEEKHTSTKRESAGARKNQPGVVVRKSGRIVVTKDNGEVEHFGCVVDYHKALAPNLLCSSDTFHNTW